MSGPRKTPVRAVGTSRRGFFFKTSAAAAAAVTAVPAMALVSSPSVGAAFQHGVASGDPLSDRVILWTRITLAQPRSAVNVSWTVASDPAMSQVVQRGTAKTNPARDYTVKVDASGLQPGSTYYYRFTVDGQMSPVGRTRTLPVGAVQRLRLAVVSCSNHAYGYFNAYRRVAERADLDAVVHLGDYLYEYGAAQYGSARTPEPAHEMVTLGDYRLRHAQYKRDADLQAVHQQHPMICIWDDHEITNDAWRDGAQNHTEGAEGTWTSRVQVGLQAYYEWMPVRIPDATQPRRNQRAFAFGDLIDLVMLEERVSARSKQLTATIPTALGNAFAQTGDFADATRTLLGAEQEAWLAGRLRTSPARWKFIGQGVMFAQLKLQGAPLASGGGLFINTDQWDGYQPARDRIYDILNGTALHAPVDNCVVLTGDIHSGWAADLTQDPNNPDLATGGYSAATGQGSKAVEFVATSITSPGLNDAGNNTANYLRSVNPHFKHIDFNQRGYLLVDVTPQRVMGEWWTVDTVASASNVQTFSVAFEVQHGSNHLSPGAQTTPRANPPAPAP
jgi:alkaline phosphatase D